MFIAKRSDAPITLRQASGFSSVIESIESRMNVTSTAELTRSQTLVAYIFSFVAPLGALMIHMTFAPWLAPVPSPPFFLAIALSAWVGGMNTGLVSTLIAAACVNLYFFSPVWEIKWNVPALASTLLIVAVGLILAFRCAYVRRRMDEQVVLSTKAAQARIRSESTLRHVTENIRDVFYITEVAFSRIIYVSPAYETIWQVSREELYEDGRAWLRHVHPDDLPLVLEGLTQQAESGSYDLEYRIVLPEGQIRWIHARSYPILDALGRLIRVAGLAEDVTASKMAAHDLAARQAAEAQAGARSCALATVAHELRNPLNCVALALHRLRNPQLTDIDREAIHGKIESLVNRMEQLIENIMDMSRCESGSMILHARPVKILTLLRDAVESFPPETRKKGVGLRFTHALDPSMDWSIDAPRLMQVVCNLIDNALKFTVAGATSNCMRMLRRAD